MEMLAVAQALKYVYNYVVENADCDTTWFWFLFCGTTLGFVQLFDNIIIVMSWKNTGCCTTF